MLPGAYLMAPLVVFGLSLVYITVGQTGTRGREPPHGPETAVLVAYDVADRRHDELDDDDLVFGQMADTPEHHLNHLRVSLTGVITIIGMAAQLDDVIPLALYVNG